MTCSSVRPVLVGVALSFFLLPAPARAQSAIAGVVKDTTGAVLPGVTVETSSPALIERTRSAPTDTQGQYKILDLRPGTYTVVFTLPGFSTVKRDGIELPANFTAPVNGELRVGALEETVNVTSASPVVDVQQAVTQQVLPQTLLDAVPTGGRTSSRSARRSSASRSHSRTSAAPRGCSRRISPRTAAIRKTTTSWSTAFA